MASSAGGSELFESYEQDYTALAKEISSQLHSVLPSLTGDAKRTQAKHTQSQLDEAEEILGQMELEVFNIPSTVRNRLQTRLRSYRTDLDQLKKGLRKANYGLAASRQELFGNRDSLSSPAEFDSMSMDQRSRLLAGTERLNESGRRLQDSHALALETESVGAGILADLRAQREQIIHTHDTLLEADSHVDRAQRTIKTMARR
ncbi:t-SNARE VTI1 [Dispira simplex]|nr:t-SNARE VTI1 [Dispira simplex]